MMQNWLKLMKNGQRQNLQSDFFYTLMYTNEFECVLISFLFLYEIFMEICNGFALCCLNIFAGLLSWNELECHVNLEEELNNLTNHGLEGEAARHGN